MKRKNSLYFEGKIVYCFIKVRQKFINKRGQHQKCVFLAGAKLCSTKNFSSFSFLVSQLLSRSNPPSPSADAESLLFKIIICSDF